MFVFGLTCCFGLVAPELEKDPAPKFEADFEPPPEKALELDRVLGFGKAPGLLIILIFLLLSFEKSGSVAAVRPTEQFALSSFYLYSHHFTSFRFDLVGAAVGVKLHIPGAG